MADAAVRAAGGSPDGIVAVDTDLDGRDDLLVTSPGQVVVVDPAEGAGIGSWDIRAVRHALTAVMRRRPESYHRTLIEHDVAGVLKPVALAAWNQWMLSLWSETVENSPGRNKRSMVGRMR